MKLYPFYAVLPATYFLLYDFGGKLFSLLVGVKQMQETSEHTELRRTVANIVENKINPFVDDWE